MKTIENHINVNILVIEDERIPEWVKEYTIWVETKCIPVMVNCGQEEKS